MYTVVARYDGQEVQDPASRRGSIASTRRISESLTFGSGSWNHATKKKSSVTTNDGQAGHHEEEPRRTSAAHSGMSGAVADKAKQDEG